MSPDALDVPPAPTAPTAAGTPVGNGENRTSLRTLVNRLRVGAETDETAMRRVLPDAAGRLHKASFTSAI